MLHTASTSITDSILSNVFLDNYTSCCCFFFFFPALDFFFNRQVRSIIKNFEEIKLPLYFLLTSRMKALDLHVFKYCLTCLPNQIRRKSGVFDLIAVINFDHFCTREERTEMVSKKIKNTCSPTPSFSMLLWSKWNKYI